jgi:hypothetical protein
MLRKKSTFKNGCGGSLINNLWVTLILKFIKFKNYIIDYKNNR